MGRINFSARLPDLPALLGLLILLDQVNDGEQRAAVRRRCDCWCGSLGCRGVVVFVVCAVASFGYIRE